MDAGLQLRLCVVANFGLTGHRGAKKTWERMRTKFEWEVMKTEME
jgi:hypothetical protein